MGASKGQHRDDGKMNDQQIGDTNQFDDLLKRMLSTPPKPHPKPAKKVTKKKTAK